MEAFEVGDRVQLVIHEWMQPRVENKDYIGTIISKTSMGYGIEWDDGYEDPIADYQASELERTS